MWIILSLCSAGAAQLRSPENDLNRVRVGLDVPASGPHNFYTKCFRHAFWYSGSTSTDYISSLGADQKTFRGKELSLGNGFGFLPTFDPTHFTLEILVWGPHQWWAPPPSTPSENEADLSEAEQPTHDVSWLPVNRICWMGPLMGSKVGPKSPILSANVFQSAFLFTPETHPLKDIPIFLSLSEYSNRVVPAPTDSSHFPNPSSLPARAAPHSHVVRINQLLLLSRSFRERNITSVRWNMMSKQQRGGGEGALVRRRREGRREWRVRDGWKAWSIREERRSHHPRNPESRVSSFPGGNPQALRFSRIILWSLLLLVLRCIAFSLFPTACFLSFSRDGSILVRDSSRINYELGFWSTASVD